MEIKPFLFIFLIFSAIYTVFRKKKKSRRNSFIKHQERITEKLREIFHKIAFSPQENSNVSILVVDDSADARSGLSSLLRAKGYEVREAESGEQALAMLKTNSYNLVLSDLKMQHVDGIEVLEETKKLYLQTEVIIMTAYASIETAIGSMQHGAYDYIFKPINMDELELLIERCLEKQKLTAKVNDLKVKLLEKELSEKKDSKVVIDLLEPFLNDNNNWIRANAAKILYTHDEKAALAIFKNMTESSDKQMQLFAERALDEIKND